MVETLKYGDWTFQEKVVAIIEKSIDHSTIVKRNQNLPVLKSGSGRTRQCDVVITSGDKPRQTITIVEVQKRNSKPDINMFGGWLEEKKEVGAQHLICVSELGFPKSILEKAAELGPTVRLMTLKHMKEAELPYGTSLFTREINYAFNRKLKGFRIDFKKLQLPSSITEIAMPQANEEAFKDSAGEAFSPKKLANRILFESIDQIDVEKFRDFQNICLEHKFLDEYRMFMQVAEVGWIELAGIYFVLDIKISTSSLVWEHEHYKQINWGTLAWASLGHGTVEGQEVKVIMPLTPTKGGDYELNSPRVIAPGEMMLIRGESKLLLECYDD